MTDRAVDIKKYSEIDLYELIGCESTANEVEIKKAYRKKALTCHPDKNPDNPKAAELFHQLQDAYMILMDKSARAAYDRIQKAKRETELRNKQLDSKRQKLKADLEARERGAKLNDYTSKSPEEIFKMEFERIMKENKRIVEEENEAIRQQIMRDRAVAQQSSSLSSSWDSSQHRIRIKWKAEKDDPTNGGYNRENLTKFFYKYGDIVALLVSAKKNGSAIVELKKQDAAEMAVLYEKGLIGNPLKLEWIGDAPKSKKPGATVTDKDYESVVLMKLRQAEERKRLIEQMMKDDE